MGARSLTFDVTGMASGFRPLKLTGKVTNPGPECSAVFNIEGKAIRIDDRLRTACSPKLQAVFDLRCTVQGIFNGHVRLIRPAGLNQRYTP